MDSTISLRDLVILVSFAIAVFLLYQWYEQQKIVAEYRKQAAENAGFIGGFLLPLLLAIPVIGILQDMGKLKITFGNPTPAIQPTDIQKADVEKS